MKVVIPKVWVELLGVDLDTADRRQIHAEIAVDDPTPYRDDQRTIVVNGPDDSWVDIRLSSGDQNYWLEAVVFEDGQDMDSTVFDIDDPEVVVGGVTVAIEWPEGGD